MYLSYLPKQIQQKETTLALKYEITKCQKKENYIFTICQWLND